MPYRRTPHYEEDSALPFPANAYAVRQYPGVAFYVLGWETVPDEDTEWSGFEVRTGNIVAVMVGDDRKHVLDPDDVSPLDDLDYCTECGQVGCSHDGRDRTEED